MKRWYIDFTTWEVNAESEEEAEAIVWKAMKEGACPRIDSVEDTEDEPPFEENDMKSVDRESIK